MYLRQNSALHRRSCSVVRFFSLAKRGTGYLELCRSAYFRSICAPFPQATVHVVAYVDDPLVSSSLVPVCCIDLNHGDMFVLHSRLNNGKYVISEVFIDYRSHRGLRTGVRLSLIHI